MAGLIAAPTLVAGVGNLFFGDDGFGPEVARRLAARPLPPGVAAADFGIRGLHLAWELVEPRERVILVDAVRRGGAPGTLYLLEPDPAALRGEVPDAHGMDLGRVLATVETLGGRLPRLWLLGCEPASLEETIGLSPAVERAAGEAVDMVLEVIARETGALPREVGRCE